VAVSRISRINVTPVKSLRVHHPDAASLRFQGVVEDRRFLLVDECGRLYHGNRDPRLVCASAAWEPESRRLAITTPGEAPVEDVVIRGERSVVDVYGRSVRGHVVQGPWATALSKFVGRPLTLVERDDDQWATDIRPITIISQASLNLIDGDGRRFRMLLEFEGVDALQEETWRGRRVRAGDATLLITGPTPRCAVPSANPEVGLRDRNVLRELRAVRGDHGSGMAWLGMYADVLTPGVVRVGDPIEPVGTVFATKLVDQLRVASTRRLRRFTLRQRAARSVPLKGGSTG
jgi:uncharacterized protein YcbX